MGATSGCWSSWASAWQAPAVLPSWWYTGGDGNGCVWWTGSNIQPFLYHGSMALVVFTCLWLSLCLGGEANWAGLEYSKGEGWKRRGVGWSKIIPKYKDLGIVAVAVWFIALSCAKMEQKHLFRQCTCFSAVDVYKAPVDKHSWWKSVCLCMYITYVTSSTHVFYLRSSSSPLQ